MVLKPEKAKTVVESWNMVSNGKKEIQNEASS